MSADGSAGADPLLANLMKAGIDPDIMSKLTTASSGSNQPLGDDDLTRFAAIVENHNKKTQELSASKSPEINSTFDTALSTTYNIATLIRGDYDSHSMGVDSPHFAFETFTQSFEQCAERAKDLHEALVNSTFEVTALRDSQLPQLSADLTTAKTQLDLQIDQTKQEQMANENMVNDLSATVSQMQDAYQNLKTNASNLDRLNPWLLTGGGFNVNGLDQSTLNEAEARLRETQTRLQDAQNQRQTLNAQGFELNHQRDLNESQMLRLSVLTSATRSAVDRTTQLIGAAGELQLRFEHLAGLAKSIPAKVGKDFPAYKKENFASDLLELCSMALFSPTAKAEVTKTCEEIVSGYQGMKMPDEVSQLAEKVRNQAGSS